MCYYSHTRGGGGESGVGFVLWHWSSSTSTEQLHSSCSSWKVTALLKGKLAAVAVGRQINPYSSFPRRFSKHDLALPISQHALNHGARPKKMAYWFPPLSFESHVPLPGLLWIESFQRILSCASDLYPSAMTHEAAVPLKYLRCWCHKLGENVGQSSCWVDHEAQWKSYHGLIKRC